MSDEIGKSSAGKAYSREELGRLIKELEATRQETEAMLRQRKLPELSPRYDDEFVSILFNHLRNLLICAALYVTGNTALSRGFPDTVHGHFLRVAANALVPLSCILYWVVVSHGSYKFASFGITRNWPFLRKGPGILITTVLFVFLSLGIFEATYDTKLPLIPSGHAPRVICASDQHASLNVLPARGGAQ